VVTILAAGSVFDPLYTALGAVLAWIYAAVSSYGVAIVLLTVVVRLVLYPLTVKQTKSMQAMQKVQPELKRLQAKYKNDKQKLNEEMMKFYREHHINPLAGCLPLLLQMPLFFVLYRLIHDLTKTVILGAIVAGGVGSGPPVTQPQIVHVQVHGGTVKQGHVTDATLTGDVQVGGQTIGRLADAHVTDGKVHGPKPTDPVKVVDAGNKTVGSIKAATVEGGRLKAVPKHIPKDSKLYRALNKTPGRMQSFGMDLAKSPGAATGGFGDVAPYYVLVALIVFTGYYQQRQMTARTPASAQNPQMQMMGKIFPVFFGFISLQIPAGVGVYFGTSNLWQIGQQSIIFRQQDKAEAGGKGKPPRSGDGEKPAPPPPPPPPPAPAEEDEAKPAKAGLGPSPGPAGNSGSGSGGARSRSRSSSRRRRRRR
jgi:YidC/Oxa1 family membrane protein insertase